MRKVPVIVNPSAGDGRLPERIAHLRERFAAAGAEADIVLPDSSEALDRRVRSEVERGAPLVLAAGGDGTLNAVARVLTGTTTALGVLPLGTLNHFAKDLGIPLDIDGAIGMALGESRVSVDVGEVNGKAFLNNSSLGIYPDLVRERTRQERRLGRGRRWATLWAAIAAMRRFPFLDMRLDLDHRPHHARVPFLFIGNNEYEMSGFRIGTRKRLDVGCLSVYTSPRATRPALLWLALRALFGRLDQARDFKAMKVQSIRVESRHKRLLVATDGEVGVMETPLEYSVRPRSLVVMAPPPA